MRHDIRNLSNQKILVSPSILAADFNQLGEEIQRVEVGQCDMLHLDVMDGHFVPNISFGAPIISAIRKSSNLLFDTHLMISHPLKYVESFIQAGADHITFHIEAEDNCLEVIKKIRECGATVGISLKPKTGVEAILPYIELVDLVLVMSVEPGFGGQSFMHEVMDKTKAIRSFIKSKSLTTQLQIDGGIDERTVAVAAQNGANLMVAGTSVFRNILGANLAIKILKEAEKELFC